jgi:carboxyl-terminal processing protease
LRAEAKWDPANEAIHMEVDYVPLDAAAARAWERGEGADQPAAPGSIRSAKYDLGRYPWRTETESRKLDGGVRYLRFPGFGDDTSMTPVYQAIDEATPAGLIVDLRRNGGGRGVQLQKFAGALLGEGALLADTKSRSETSRMLATAYPKPYTGPLVVLIGPGSGSAAEIFAATVQDQQRGKVIGRRSAGSVLQATQVALPDAGYFSLPVSDVWRAGGKRLEGVGVEPDTWILPSLVDVRAGRDPVLEAALRELAPP